MIRLMSIFYLGLAVLLLLLSIPVPVIAEDEPKVVEEMYFLDQIKETPQNLEPYLGLGKWYIQRRLFDKAEPILSQATAISPNNAAGFALFGDLYAAQQKFDKAIGMYQAALKIEPDNAQNWYALGTLYKRNGKNTEALSAYLKAEPGFTKGGLEYTRFYADLAKLYVTSGKTNEAEKLVDKLLKQDPKSAATLAAIGDIYTAIRLYDKAFPYYEQALSLNPNDTQLINRIIYSYRNSGRTKEMIAFAKKAITKTAMPEQAIQIWNQAASMFYQGGNVADLVDLYDVVGKVITDKMSRRNIQITFFNYTQNQTKSLIPIFEARYKKSPKDIDSLSMLAEIYNRTNQSDKAIVLYEKLRELQPEDSRTTDTLASLYQKKGNFEKAIVLRQEALSKNPDEGNNLANLVRLYIRVGKKDQANELVAKLKEKSANNQATLNSLISVYRELGQSEQAIAAMKEYLAIAPDKQNIQQMLIRYYLELNRPADAEKALEPMLAMLTTGTPEYQIQQSYEPAFLLYAKTRQIDKMIALYRQGEQLVSERWAKNNLRWSFINNCQQAGRIGQLISVLKEQLTQHPEDATLLFILSNAYMQNNRYAEAIPIMEQLYSQDSNNSEYENQLLNAYQNAQNWSKIAELSQRLIARYPDQTGRYTQLIQAYTQMGKPDLAEKTIKDLTNRMGQTPLLWSTLGQVYESMQKPQLAISYYEKAITANPNNAQFYTSLGRLYQQVGDNAAALKAYLKVKELGIRDYEQNQAEAAIVKAYLNTGNWKAATKEFESWLNGVRYRDWQVQETLPLLITALIQQNQVKPAWLLIVKYQQMADSNRMNVWGSPTYEYRLREVIQQSIPLQQYLEKEIEKKSRDKSIYATLVNIYLDNNRGQARLSQAVPVLEKAIKQFPNEPEPYVLLGDVYVQQQKHELAIKMYEKAVALQTAAGMNVDQSSGSQFSPNLVIVRLAGLYIQAGQRDKTFTLVKGLEKSSNPTAELRRAVAGIYETAKEYTPAIAAYQKAIELNPGDSQLRTMLIKCYLSVKKYAEAEQEANKLADLVSQPYALQELYRQLAQVYDKQELYDKEIDSYLKMIEANPQNYTWGNISNDLMNWNQSQERYEGIAAVLEKKIKENPKNLNLLTILGDIYRRLGKPPVLAN